MAILEIVAIGVFAVILLWVISMLFVPCEVRIEKAESKGDCRSEGTRSGSLSDRL